MYFFTV
jgi:hypothetical protein